MTRYEYKLIQAPTEPPKVKGVKGAVPRYLHGLTDAMNEMGREGWSYVRTDRLPVTSRKGLLRRRDVHEELVMVFRRAIAEGAVPAAAPIRTAAPSPEPQPEIAEAPEPWPAPEPNEPVLHDPDVREEPAADRPPPRLFGRSADFSRRQDDGAPRLSARRD